MMCPDHPKNVAVLGTGYVASAYLRALCFLGIRPIVLSRNWIDYTNTQELSYYLKAHAADMLINASGFTGNSVDDAQIIDKKMTCYHSHVTVSRYTSKLAKELGIPYIQVSSGCVFGGGDFAWLETDKPNFTSNFYQHCKISAENEVMESGSEAYVFRIRMPFSWHDHPRNWLTKLCNHDKILDGLNSITFLDEYAMRSFQLVADKKGKPGIYHCAYQTPVRTLDIAHELVKAGLRTKPIELWDPKEFEKHHVRRSEAILDCTKFEKAYGAIFGSPVSAIQWCISNYGGVGPLGRPPTM